MPASIRSYLHTRRLGIALAVAFVTLPRMAGAASLAELEVTEESRNSPGASVTFGYFNLAILTW